MTSGRLCRTVATKRLKSVSTTFCSICFSSGVSSRIGEPMSLRAPVLMAVLSSPSFLNSPCTFTNSDITPTDPVSAAGWR